MKCIRANKNATSNPSMVLGNRTKSALDLLLRSKRLAEVMKATTTLGERASERAGNVYRHNGCIHY